MKYRNSLVKSVVFSIFLLGHLQYSQGANLADTFERRVQPPSVPRQTPKPTPKATPKPTPSPTPIPVPSYVKLNVKHQMQEYLLCVPTSASMMASSSGWNYPPRQIKLATLGLPWYGQNTPFNYWTTTSVNSLFAGLAYLNIKNWRSEFYNISDFQKGLDEIKESLRRGYPVMILIWYSPTFGHAMVVSGYDDRSQMLIMNDPAIHAPGTAYFTYNSLRDNYWKNRLGYRGAVFMLQKTPKSAVSLAFSSGKNPSANINY